MVTLEITWSQSQTGDKTAMTDSARARSQISQIHTTKTEGHMNVWLRMDWQGFYRTYAGAILQEVFESSRWDQSKDYARYCILWFLCPKQRIT